MMRKTIGILFCAVIMICAMSITSLAADIGPGYTGWNQLSDGGYEYYVSGEKVINQSIAVDGKQYYFDTNGVFREGSSNVTQVVPITDASGAPAAQANPATDNAAVPSTETPAADVAATQGAATATDPAITPSVYVSEEWKNRPNPYSTPDVVEVDIPKQHVWCYRNNVLVWDSYCTTGCVEKGTETPRGNFTIQAKQRQKYLMGPKDPVTGEPKWKNWVEYWMPFYNGCGLHDASWRKKFAGTIYVYAGSHGCVNLPQERVADLYDRVYVGMSCIVHD